MIPERNGEYMFQARKETNFAFKGRICFLQKEKISSTNKEIRKRELRYNFDSAYSPW
jgi:hypothetical protein